MVLTNLKRKKRIIARPSLIRSGFKPNRKSSRLFNGKRYIRLGNFNVQKFADNLKERYHNKNYKALVIKSGPNYQVWIRKEE